MSTTIILILAGVILVLSGCVTLKEGGTFYSEEHGIEYSHYYHPGSGVDVEHVFIKNEES